MVAFKEEDKAKKQQPKSPKAGHHSEDEIIQELSSLTRQQEPVRAATRPSTPLRSHMRLPFSTPCLDGAVVH